MNRDEQTLIQNLFGKLAEAERSAPPRDEGADRLISESVGRQPGAPYYMAQTILIQEQALEAAQARIEALEAQGSASQGSSGGFLSSIFGGGSRQQPVARPSYNQQSGGYGQPSASGPQGDPWNNGGRGGFAQQDGAFGGGRMGGGGFMAGAAQTAMGVAGGVVLGSMLSNAFFGDAAAAGSETTADADQASDGAADQDQTPDAEPASADDAGGDFDGGDFEEI